MADALKNMLNKAMNQKQQRDTARSTQHGEFQALWDRAVEYGLAAGNQHKPQPMNLVGRSPQGGVEHYHVPEGLCGFAWVVIRPATTPFGRWLKATGRASKAYGGGLQVWISDHEQSYERKQAHASAMAEVFRAAGINAYAGGRLD